MNSMLYWGMGFFALGLILLLAGFGLDGTVAAPAVTGLNDRFANLHALATKGQLITTGTGACVVGAVFIAASAIVDALAAVGVRMATVETTVSSAVAAASGPVPVPTGRSVTRPADFKSMFKENGVEIWSNSDGKAWSGGNVFDSVEEAKRWALAR